jgi:hypothetical protein
MRTILLRGDPMSSAARKELFSERVAAGTRTYFLDVKESQQGELYLVISESRAVDDGFEHSRVMVFEDHLEPFIDGLSCSAGNPLRLGSPKARPSREVAPPGQNDERSCTARGFAAYGCAGEKSICLAFLAPGSDKIA